MSSSRLPGKVLKKVNNKELLLYQIKRVRFSQYINKIIVATSTDESDNPIELFCRKNGISFYRGSLANVLMRFIDIKNSYNPDLMIRLTADCPLIDYNIIDESIEDFFKYKPDILATNNETGYPRGFDVEVFKPDLLDEINNSTKDLSVLEHVTLYAYLNYKKFKIYIKQPPDDLKGFNRYRFCVDTPVDFEVVSYVLNHFNRMDFSIYDIKELVDRNGEFFEKNTNINQKIVLDFDQIYNFHKFS